MRPLDAEERALLELARDGGDPSDEDRARVRAALAARLGVVAGLGVAAGLGTSAKAAVAAAAGSGLGSTATTAGAAGVAGGALASGGAVAGGALAVKLIGVAVVVASAVGVPAVAVHRARHARVAAVTAPERTNAGRRELPAIAPAKGPPPVSAPSEAPPPALQDTEQPPEAGQEATARSAAGAITSPDRPAQPAMHALGTIARRSESAVRSAVAARPASPPARPALADSERAARSAVPAPRTAQPTLADEARLVHEGVAALRAGDPAGALARLDAHAALYPRGALAEERAAERVLALADLGRAAEARAAAEEFLRAHPDSPLAPRLRARLRALDAGR